jgi:hypothetical protein
MSEHSFNTHIAESIRDRLRCAGIDAIVIGRYSGAGYSAAMR